ncbi:MAG: hypothetical protein ACRDRH_03545 [Pseudonocardia sp.]
MIGPTMAWPRLGLALLLSRPTVWLVGLLSLGVMWSSLPPGLPPGTTAVGVWWSTGLAASGTFVVQLVVFHIAVTADLYLAARRQGVIVYANLLLGTGRWTVTVVAFALVAAVSHVLLWCVATAVRCWSHAGAAGLDPAAAEATRLPGDENGALSQLVILASAVLTLALVHLVVVALVHVVADGVTIAVVCGVWCLAELPLSVADRGQVLARFVDPTTILSPTTVLTRLQEGSTWALATAGGVVLCLTALLILVLVGSRRFRAIVTAT